MQNDSLKSQVFSVATESVISELFVPWMNSDTEGITRFPCWLWQIAVYQNLLSWLVEVSSLTDDNRQIVYSVTCQLYFD